MLEKILLKPLRSKENPILIIREYSITKFFTFAIISGLYFGMLFFMYPLLSYNTLTAVIFICGILAVVLYAVRTFIIWYLDAMIVTGERLIDVEQRGLFARQVQEIAWSNVTDVVYKQRGIMGTLCNYGTVLISTNHLTSPVELHHVHHPQHIRDLLAEYAKKK